MIIAVDFDGTLVEHRYPDIGEEVPNAFYWLEEFQKLGIKLILYTMRSGKTLKAAVKFCNDRRINFYGVNENPEQKDWTDSPKVYAHRYIDDSAFGCPLTGTENGSAVVDWDIVGPMITAWAKVKQNES